MSNLRWIERDGRMILQHNHTGQGWDIWEDVPTHQEPKKVSVEDALTNHFNSKGALLTPFGYAVSAIEFFRARLKCSGYSSWHTIQDVEKYLFGEE